MNHRSYSLYLRDYTTVVAWAKSSTYLAIGTSRGNIILYDQTTAKYILTDLKDLRNVFVGNCHCLDNILVV